MGEPYNVHIRTTGDPSGAELTQDALEKTAQAGEKIVDAVTKGDRATAAFVGKLKQLTPEQIDRVEKEFRQLIRAEEEAGRDAAALRAQLQALDNVKLDKVSKQTSGIFGGVTGGVLAANAISSATNALRNYGRTSVELADQIEDLASRAGVLPEELQIIGNVAARNNGSLQGTADALSKVQISAQGAIDKAGPLREHFDGLGISVDDLKNLSPDQLFYKIAEAVSTSNDRGRTYADVVAVMGKSSKDLFTTMELGPERIRALGAAMGVFNKETTTALAEANDTLEKFQNKLTVAAGKFIQVVGTGYQEYYRQLTMTEPEIQKLVQAETDAAAAADEAKKKSSTFASALDDVSDSASGAAIDLQNLETIERQFLNRALAKLPLAEQLKALREEIDRVRTEAGRSLPGLKFADSNALFELSKTAGLSKETRKQIIGLAVEYATLEDKLKQTAAADQQLQPDRIKRIAEIKTELEKPNVPLTARQKLLAEELRLLGEIKLAAEARAKADAPVAAAPKPAPKPISDPADLRRQSDTLERKSQTEPLSRELDALAARLENRTREALRPIPLSIDQIVETALRGFTVVDESLQTIPLALADAADPIKENVAAATTQMETEITNLGAALAGFNGVTISGFSTLAQLQNAAKADLQRQIDKLAIRISANERVTP